jgi:hypothetical protein
MRDDDDRHEPNAPLASRTRTTTEEDDGDSEILATTQHHADADGVHNNPAPFERGENQRRATRDRCHLRVEVRQG